MVVYKLSDACYYLDKHARILHGSLLLYLAHDLCFGVAAAECAEACAAEGVHLAG